LTEKEVPVGRIVIPCPCPCPCPCPLNPVGLKPLKAPLWKGGLLAGDIVLEFPTGPAAVKALKFCPGGVVVVNCVPPVGGLETP
jgi:hypothetical protein